MKLRAVHFSPPPMPLSVVTWNVNGARARDAEVAALLRPPNNYDVVCLQEVKCPGPPPKTTAAIAENDYYTLWNGGQRKGHHGTALLVRKALNPVPLPLQGGVPHAEDEGRLCDLRVGNLTFMSVYVPNSGVGKPPLQRLDFRTDAWDPAFVAHVQREYNAGQHVLVCGDLNVAVHKHDVHNPKTLTRKAGYTNAERTSAREGLFAIMDDVWTRLHGEAAEGDTDHFTFFGRFQREARKGWRLDYQLRSPQFPSATSIAVVPHGTSDHLALAARYNADVAPAPTDGALPAEEAPRTALRFGSNLSDLPYSAFL